MSGGVYEQLRYLCDLSTGLMCRLHHMKQRYQTKDMRRAPNCMVSSNFANIRRKIERGFAKSNPCTLIEKDNSFEDFSNEAGKIVEDMEDDFKTYIDLEDFQEVARDKLLEVVGATAKFEFQANLDLTVKTLDLLVAYTKLHFLLRVVENKELMLGMFGAAYQIANKTEHTAYQRVCAYIKQYDERAITPIRDAMKPISTQVGRAIVEFYDIYEKLMEKNKLQQFRRKAYFNLLETPQKLVFPAMDMIYTEILYLDRLKEWIVLGLLVCPNVLSTMGPNQSGKRKKDMLLSKPMKLLKLALEDSFVITIFRDEVILIHKEWESLFKFLRGHKILAIPGNPIQVVRNAEIHAIEYGCKMHASRRAMLRICMQQTLRLSEQCLGILGPKFPMILAMIAYAKFELDYYYNHHKRQPRVIKDLLAKRGKKNEQDYSDVEISFIIWLCDAMRQLCHNNLDIVRKYYAEYINGTHLRAIEPLQASVAKSPQVKACLQRCISLMKEVNPAAQLHDLSQLRRNWLQAQVLISDTAKGYVAQLQRDGDLRGLVHRMSVVMLHSRFVDQQTELLVEFGSLKNLWWYGDQVKHDFDITLAKKYCQTPAAKHCMSFVRSCASALENTHPVCPLERAEIGQASVKLARFRLNKITETIIEAIEYISIRRGKLNGTSAVIRASFMDEQRPDYPGKESDPRNHMMVGSQKKATTHLSMMCRAMVSYDRIVVYNTEFIPMLFLLERLRKKFAQYMGGLANTCFFHPELIPERVERMVNVMNLASQFLGLKISSLIREVFQNQVQMQDVTLHNLTTPVTNSVSGKKGESQTTVQIIAKNLCKFLAGVCHRAAAGASPYDDENQPITYSEVYRGFVQWCIEGKSERQRVHARYTVERVAPLCGLLGSAGVRIVQRQLLSTVEVSIESILKIVKRNKPYLQEFTNALRGAGDLFEVIAKIQPSDFKSLLDQSVVVGVYFTMRDILGQGLGLATESMPALKQFFGSIMHSCEGKGMEQMEVLASSCGISTVNDGRLAAVFRQKAESSSDPELVSYIPVMYAASFACASFWKVSIFNAKLNGFRNNAHTIPLVVWKFISSLVGEGEGRKRTELCKNFIEASVAVLLQLKLKQSDRNFRMMPLRAMMLLVQMAVDLFPCLDQSVIENCLPFKLTHFAWSDVMRGRQSNTGDERRIEDLSSRRETGGPDAGAH